MATNRLPILGQPAPTYAANPAKLGLRHARQGVQLAVLAAWFALFLLTRRQVEGLAPDLFLASDPLVAALTMGSAMVVVPTLARALFFVVFTLVFGRAFCGWICPLGTLIDLAAKVLRPPQLPGSLETHRRLQLVKYVVLAVMVFGALLSAQWVYLLDPLVLLYRGMTSIYPAVTAVAPVQGALGQSYHGLAFLPVALLVGVLALTAITPRFYCRYLCPLGAFYGLLSRAPIIRRRVTGCDGCSSAGTDKQCVTGCRMGAVGSNPHLSQNHECIRCMSGRSFCPQEAIHFDARPPGPVERKDLPLDVDRRRLLVAGGAGVALAPLVGLSAYHRGREGQVIRPPRVTDEETFVDQCIRCAMCVQACPTQTLQLTHLEAGVAGFWTPAITPSVGGCISGCNACSVACPTDAIPVFSALERDKWAVKMGTAVLEKDRCVSYADALPCRKCVDVCPTKAFVIAPATEQLPERPASVDYVRCVGCGLCEQECGKIVFGHPALLTFSHGRGQPTVLAEKPSEDYETPST